MTCPLRSTAIALPALVGLVACEGDTSASNEAALLTPAEGNCIISAETQIGTSGITVARTEVSEANTSVYLNVPGSAEEWLCLSTAGGQVQEVRRTGAEGTL